MQVQLHLMKLIAQGSVVTASVIVTATCRILLAYYCSKLEYGGQIHLRQNWAYHLLDQMNLSSERQPYQQILLN